MSNSWWEMPGPSRFAAQIARELLKGNNICICLPEYSPRGLTDAIKAALGNNVSVTCDDSARHWASLNISANGNDRPVEILFSQFAPDCSSQLVRNANLLSQQTSFARKIIWLEGITPHNWLAWKKFLIEYAHVSRAAASPLEQTVFCAPLVGKLAETPPPEDARLLARNCGEIVDSLDMLIFTSRLFHSRPMPTLQKRAVIAIVANLALWDPAVSERFAYEEIEQILNPTPILAEIAEQRNWRDALPLLNRCFWYAGMKEIFDGVERIHSAALAVLDSDHEIKRRIWSAEVGVLFPFVDEKRRELIAKYSKVLRVPFKPLDSNKEITELHNLEVGHIETQLLKDRSSKSSSLGRYVRRLKDIRNDLAHFKPLTLERLLFEEIKELNEVWK